MFYTTGNFTIGDIGQEEISDEKAVRTLNTVLIVRFEVSTAVTMMIIIFWEMIIITVLIIPHPNIS
jgi:hypothetical protein